MSEGDSLTEAGRHVRAVWAQGNDVVEPSSVVPCAREHEPERVCILPDGHAAAPVPPVPDLREAVAAALAEHWEVDVDNGGDQTEFFCDCTATIARGAPVDLDALHRAHVADAVLAIPAIATALGEQP